MAVKMGHLHLKTPDPQKTAKWWVENLGAKITAQGLRGTGYTLELDGVTFNVTEFNKEQTRPQSNGLEHFGIYTDDFNNVVNKLKANGARFLESTKNGTFFFETPDGVQLEVMAMERYKSRPGS